MLQSQDPANLVATLLQLAEPALACEPAEIKPPVAQSRDGRGSQGPGFKSRANPSARQRSGLRPLSDGFLRFYINWGERRGATVPRLLSHVCRRGGISGKQVGAIDIQAQGATFEVATDVARGFEVKVRDTDERDPGLRIEPYRETAGPADHSAAPAGRRPQPGQGGGQRPPGRKRAQAAGARRSRVRG